MAGVNGRYVDSPVGHKRGRAVILGIAMWANTELLRDDAHEHKEMLGIRVRQSHRTLTSPRESRGQFARTGVRRSTQRVPCVHIGEWPVVLASPPNCHVSRYRRCMTRVIGGAAWYPQVALAIGGAVSERIGAELKLRERGGRLSGRRNPSPARCCLSVCAVLHGRRLTASRPIRTCKARVESQPRQRCELWLKAYACSTPVSF